MTDAAGRAAAVRAASRPAAEGSGSGQHDPRQRTDRESACGNQKTDMKRLLAPLVGLADSLSSLITLVMGVHILLEVTLRLVFQTSLLGTNVIVANFYMVGLIFWGMFVMSYRNEQISADIVANQLPLPVRRVTDRIAVILSALFFVALSAGLGYAAWQKTETGYEIDAIFDMIPLWPVYWAAFAGAVLAALVEIGRSLAPYERWASPGAGFAQRS